MFFAANCYGSFMLKEAYNHITTPEPQRLKACARFLDVTERTLSDWIKGKKEPPRAACYALWHESTLGRAVTAAHSEQGAHYLRLLTLRQAETIAAMQSRIDAQADEIEALKRDAVGAASNERFFVRY